MLPNKTRTQPANPAPSHPASANGPGAQFFDKWTVHTNITQPADFDHRLNNIVSSWSTYALIYDGEFDPGSG